MRDNPVSRHGERRARAPADRRRLDEQHLRGGALQCLAVGQGRPERLYVGTDREGLWRSVDGGRTWSRPTESLEGRDVTAVAVAPAEDGRPGAVYAGTEPSLLFRSTDGGDHWAELEGMTRLPSAPTWSFPPRPETHHVRWIGVDPRHPGHLYVAVEAGALLRSRDAGESWLDRVDTGPYDTHTLAIHPRTGRLHSAAGDGYFESGDGGDNWTEIDKGLRHGYLYGVAVLPGDPEVVVVSAASGPYQAYSAPNATTYLYRKRGQRWEQAHEGLPEPRGTTIATLTTHQTEPDAVYAATNRGIFRSGDAGATWKQVEIRWPEEFLSESVQGFAVAEV